VGGGGLLNMKRVFCFSPQFLSETFRILRRNERDMIIKMYNGLRIKAPSILVRF